MTYEEFKAAVEDTGKYYVTEDIDSVFVIRKNFSSGSIRISKNVVAFIEFKFDAYGKDEADLIRAVLELAETPLEKREPEKKYYLKHKFLGTPPEVYLNIYEGEYLILNSIETKEAQTTFTLKEIEDIKNKYDVTLEDFEMIEVEQ